jgi:hypothetical protein
MTQWSTYTPYDISYTLDDTDPVDSTRMKVARLVSWLVIGTTAVLVGSQIALNGVGDLLASLALGF